MKQPGEMVELLKIRAEVQQTADNAIVALLNTVQMILQLRRTVPLDKRALETAENRFREIIAYVEIARREFEHDFGVPR